MTRTRATRPPPVRRAARSAFLAAVVVGSGIAAQQLSPHDAGLELLENAAATAAGLFAIILMFGPVSGGHFNPVVSLVDATFGGISRRDALAYLPAQATGCVVGAIIANAMFARRRSASPPTTAGARAPARGGGRDARADPRDLRAGPHSRSAIAPAAVGAYIGAAYFFTSSSCFANPAITIGRMLSDTFAGIAPASVPAFVVAQAAWRRDRDRRDPGPVPARHPAQAATRAPHGDEVRHHAQVR